MKKILIFSLAYYPRHVGGAEVAIKEITGRIGVEEYEFHMITLRFDETLSTTETIGNVHIHRVGFGGKYISKILYVFLATLRAKRLHTQEHFSGIWAMMTYMLFPTVLARMLGVRIPYALTLQDGDPYERVMKRWFIRPFSPLLTYGFRKATLIQSISSHLATWATQMGATCPSIIVPNGVDIDTFSISLDTQEREKLRTQFGVTATDVLLVSTSRLVHKNAYDDIIHALTSLPQNVHLLAVGKGQEEVNLKALVKKLGLEERVVFTGHVEYSAIPKYLLAGDVFIRPSRSEGMGNSFIEAMTAGLPVIATQEGGLADFIFGEKENPNIPATAWVVPANNPHAIAEAVTSILNHPEKVNEVVQNARTFIAGKYEWNTIAKDMKEQVFVTISK